MKSSNNSLLVGRRITVAVAVAFVASCTHSSVFDKADTNDDDRISSSEVEEMLIDGVFENADANSDGKVSLAEWKAANPNDSATLFSARDANGDQLVTKEEMRSYAKRTGMFRDVAKKIDEDGNGYISAAEAEKLRGGLSKN